MWVEWNLCPRGLIHPDSAAYVCLKAVSLFLAEGVLLYVEETCGRRQDRGPASRRA